MPTTSHAGSWRRHATIRATPERRIKPSTTRSRAGCWSSAAFLPLPAVLAAGGREHEILISLEDFVRAGKALHARLADEVRARAGEARPLLVLSARASRQPGLSSHLRERSGLEVFELPHDAAVLAALRHHPRIRREGDALPFVTRLPAWDSASVALDEPKAP